MNNDSLSPFITGGIIGIILAILGFPFYMFVIILLASLLCLSILSSLQCQHNDE